MIQRRTLLLSLTALSACGTQQQTPDQLKSYIEALSTGTSAILTSLQAVPGVRLTVGQVSSIQDALNTIQANAAAIANAATPGSDNVQAIANAVTALVPLVAPFYPAAPAVAAVMQAALALVPVVLAMAGRQTAGTAPTMAPERAAEVLRARGR